MKVINTYIIRGSVPALLYECENGKFYLLHLAGGGGFINAVAAAKMIQDAKSGL